MLAIFVAIVTPPLIIAGALQLDLETTGYLVSMSLMVSGIATFIQCRTVGPIGCGLLCIQGTSFSFIGPIISAGLTGGLSAIFGATIVASTVEMFVSRILKYTRRVITPLVSGIVVTLIGMSLIKVGIIACGGVRYNQEALACTYKGKNIVELLSLTASQAMEVFEDAKIKKRLKVMEQVGLSYLTLGQPLSTLSGGERQRIKLAKKLGKKGSIIVMDEPTTGLHMSDTQNLLKLFDMIISRGNTLVIIEHNLDIIKRADYIVDLGPEGGGEGGTVVATGTPEQVAQNPASYTGRYLAPVLERDRVRPVPGEKAARAKKKP